MDLFKKAFLFFVGSIVVAYEETAKAVKEQQKKLGKAVTKAKA